MTSKYTYTMKVLNFFTMMAVLPQLLLSKSEVPIGHLKPLGSHRPPETNLIDETDEMPTPQEFWTKYVKPSRALVMRGAAKHSKGFSKWTDEYLMKHFSDLELRLEGKKEKSGLIPIGDKGVGRSTLGHFLKSYHEKAGDTYIVSELPSPMFKDFSVIPPLTCGAFKNRLVEVDIWMSGGGTKSILHKDAFNAINCLLNGTKQWKMIEYKYEDKIYKAWEPPQMIGGFSRINIEQVDLIKQPLVSEVPWSFVNINAGDCLFLPKSYYHQVSSFGTNNVAIALLFSRFEHVDELDLSDCNRPLHPTPLSEMDLDWIYSGHGNLSMGNTDLEVTREALRLFFGNKKTLTRDEALQKGKEKMTDIEIEKKLYYLQGVRDTIEWWFGRLADSNGIMTLDRVNGLSRDELRSLVLDLEGTDLTNTEDHEYGYVDYEEIRDIFASFIEAKKTLKRKAFIDIYIKNTAGTETFAAKLFDKVDTNADGEISSGEHNTRLEDALEPYIRWAAANAERVVSDTDEGDTDGNEDRPNQDSTKHEEL